LTLCSVYALFDQAYTATARRKSHDAQEALYAMMLPKQPSADFGVLTARLRRLLLLDTSVFEEVRDDAAATIPCISVVLGATLLAALGGWFWWLLQPFQDETRVLVQSVVMGTLFSIALWIVWMLVTWVVLTQLFREDADWQQMLRTMGLASLPFALSFWVFIPGIGGGIGLASLALLFGLSNIAIQAVTRADPARILVANAAGFAVWAVVLGLLVTSSNYLAPGVFLFDSPVEAAGGGLAEFCESLIL
jgi:hypothetical protein